MSNQRLCVQILYAQDGGFHEQTVSVPAAGRSDHDNLMDFLANDPAVQQECFIHFGRVCSAVVVGEEDARSADQAPS